MIRHLTLQMQLRLVRYPSEAVLTVKIETEALRDWCLSLCLLKEGLIDALLVDEEGSKRKLEISVDGTRPRRGKASFDGENAWLKLSMNDVETVLHFFLKCYRDGAGEVDHLDLQVTSLTEKRDVSITFKVPEAVEPVSSEEARRRLGLD